MMALKDFQRWGNLEIGCLQNVQSNQPKLLEVM